MRLHEFLEFNKLEQSHIIGGAEWVGSKRNMALLTVLYFIDDFYVEAAYRVSDMMIIDLYGVNNQTTIDSYKKDKEINPLTLSLYKDFKSPGYDQRFALTFSR